jgi:hypothetical protein
MFWDDHDHIHNSNLRWWCEWRRRAWRMSRLLQVYKQFTAAPNDQTVLYYLIPVTISQTFHLQNVLFVNITRHANSWNTPHLTLNNNKSTKLFCQFFLIKVNHFMFGLQNIAAPVVPFLPHVDIFWLRMKYLQLYVNQPTIDCDVILYTSFELVNKYLFDIDFRCIQVDKHSPIQVYHLHT